MRSSMTRGTFKSLIAVAALILSAAFVYAQSNTADIVGTVTDITGAVVPGANVTSKNLGTGQVRTVQSNAVGEYAFNLLQVGTYTLQVEAAGFKQFKVPSVTISAGDRLRVDAQMQTGGTSETVTVTSVAPALQTDSSTVGGLVENAQVQDLPLNGRNFINLVQLQAGVTPGLGGAFGAGTKPDDHRETSSYSANGQTDQANNNLIDGFDNNDRLIGVIGVRPSPDAIQEVKVETGLYTAEVGRSAGGVVDIITKSGTNNVHGSVYEYFRNDIFDASNYFALPGKKTKLRQNQYGGSIGGPIKKDKTFFFADYEGFRQVNGETLISTVPTAFDQANCSLATGCDFTDQMAIDGFAYPAADYKVPVGVLAAMGSASQIGMQYFKMYPAPNNPSSHFFNNYVNTPSMTQNTELLDFRIDHHVSEKSTFYSRYSFNNVNTFLPGTFPTVTIGSVSGVQPGAGTFGSANAEFAGKSHERQMQLGVTLTHIFQPNLMGEVKFGFMRNYVASLTANDGLSPATAMGYSGVNVTGMPQTNGLPSFILGAFTGLGDTAFQPEYESDNNYQYMADVVYSPVNHIIKIGAGIIQRQAMNDQSIFPRGAGFMVGASAGVILSSFYNGFQGDGAYAHAGPLEDLVLGQADSMFRQTSLVAAKFRTWEPSVYIQDDWRITHRITLNLGIRYDLFTPYTSANDAITNFDFNKLLLVGPSLPGDNQSNATAGVKPEYGDVAPRVGFAVDMGRGLVVRGGFGMSYFPGNFTLQSFLKNAPYASSFMCGFANTANLRPCEYTALAAYAGKAYGLNYALGSMPAPVIDMTQATNRANYADKLFYAMDFNFKPTYIMQYSLQVQKDFHGNVAGIGYVGNMGRHLVGYPNLNQAPYGPVEDAHGNIVTPGAPTPIPSLPNTVISTGVSAGVSNYNALQVTLERRLTKGLSANANYTWAHALANISSNGESPGNIPNPDRFSCVGACHINIPGSTNYTIGKSWQVYDYGNSEMDVRQRFAFTVSYALPFGNKLTGAAGLLAKGWSTNALYFYQTGLPFTVQNTQNAPDPGATYDGFTNLMSRPNIIGKAKAANATPAMYLNTAAFAVQAAGTLGNERKNQITAPNDTSFNLSLLKAFTLRDELKLQFRAEAFNVSNTPSFNPPDNGLGDPQFGVISSTIPQAPPRQIQFALKVLF